MKAKIVLGLIGLGVVAGAVVGILPNWQPETLEKNSTKSSETIPNQAVQPGAKPQPNQTDKPQSVQGSSNNIQSKNSNLIPKVYQIETQGNRLVAVAIPTSAENEEKALRESLLSLISGSSNSGSQNSGSKGSNSNTLHSEVPNETKLLGLSLQGKEIRLNLSKEFTSGGGAASMNGRLTQVIYTATSLNPDAKLYLSVEGKPLKYLGGEGLEVPQPVTRQDFAAEF